MPFEHQQKEFPLNLVHERDWQSVHAYLTERAREICGCLFGFSPKVSIKHYQFNASEQFWHADIRIDYTCSLSAKQFSIDGQFVSFITYGEYFQYDPIPSNITVHLFKIGISENILEQLSNGQIKLHW